MSDERRKQSPELDLSSVERDLFGELFSFHTKTMDLLRQSSLDDEKLELAGDRIKSLLDDTMADMKSTKDPNMAARLNVAYIEVQRIVKELSDTCDGSSDE